MESPTSDDGHDVRVPRPPGEAGEILEEVKTSEDHKLGDDGLHWVFDLAKHPGLTRLCTLNLGDNEIHSLSPLGGLTGLCELALGTNQVQSVRPLAELSHLKTLQLGHNNIQDVSPLATLCDLTIHLTSLPESKDSVT